VSLLTKKLDQDMTDRLKSKGGRNRNSSLPWPRAPTFPLTPREGGNQHTAGLRNVRDAPPTPRPYCHPGTKRMSCSMKKAAVLNRLIPPNARLEKCGHRMLRPQIHDRSPEMGGCTRTVAPSVLIPSIRAVSELGNRARCEHPGGQPPTGSFLAELLPAFGGRGPVAGRSGPVGRDTLPQCLLWENEQQCASPPEEQGDTSLQRGVESKHTC